MNYENRLAMIVTHAWETFTQNGLGLDAEDREKTSQLVRDAAVMTYTSVSTDEQWLAATLRCAALLRGLPKMGTAELEHAVEALVDANGLYLVVCTLSRITGEKAEHIASAWQDATMAKGWDRVARSLEKVACQITELGI